MCERGRALRVAHPVARLLQVEPVLERPLRQDVDGLQGAVQPLRQDDGLGLERLGRRFPKHLGPPHLAHAERIFARWGVWAVFFGRFVALLRILAGPLAGALKVPLRVLRSAPAALPNLDEVRSLRRKVLAQAI